MFYLILSMLLFNSAKIIDLTPLSSLSELEKSAAIYTRLRASRQQSEAVQILGSAGSKADSQAAPGKA
jgi:hypothetical protein